MDLLWLQTLRFFRRFVFGHQRKSKNKAPEAREGPKTRPRKREEGQTRCPGSQRRSEKKRPEARGAPKQDPGSQRRSKNDAPEVRGGPKTSAWKPRRGPKNELPEARGSPKTSSRKREEVQQRAPRRQRSKNKPPQARGVQKRAAGSQRRSKNEPPEARGGPNTNAPEARGGPKKAPGSQRSPKTRPRKPKEAQKRRPNHLYDKDSGHEADFAQIPSTGIETRSSPLLLPPISRGLLAHRRPPLLHRHGCGEAPQAPSCQCSCTLAFLLAETDAEAETTCPSFPKAGIEIAGHPPAAPVCKQRPSRRRHRLVSSPVPWHSCLQRHDTQVKTTVPMFQGHGPHFWTSPSGFRGLFFWTFSGRWISSGFRTLFFGPPLASGPRFWTSSGFQEFFPKATAKGSFEKSTTIKDCRSDRCLERLSSKTTEVIRVLKDCHQRLPK